MKNKEELFKSVRRAIMEDPSIVKEILGMVSVGLLDYQEKCRLNESAALEGLLYPDTIKSVKMYASLINPMYILFPNGKLGHYSSLSKEGWDVFIERTKKEFSGGIQPRDYDWLETTRGADVLAWFKREVEPYLVLAEE